MVLELKCQECSQIASSSEKKRLANGTKEEAPQRAFKKTYLVAFLAHIDATRTTKICG